MEPSIHERIDQSKIEGWKNRLEPLGFVHNGGSEFVYEYWDFTLKFCPSQYNDGLIEKIAVQQLIDKAVNVGKSEQKKMTRQALGLDG